MSQSRADFAVFGSTPLARLIAGLLAHRHGKRVVILGDSQSRFLLPRAIDLSVGAFTRPQTWALLAETLPETIKLLARIGGKAGMDRLDPVFFAETPMGRQGIAYMRHVAAGFGHATERLAPGALGPDREAIVMRDAVQLQRPLLEPALDKWLDRLNVIRPLSSQTSAALQADGSVRIIDGSDIIEAETALLTDDAAIMAHLPAGQIPLLFEIEASATILTEPTLPLAAPVMMQIDSGLCLTQLGSRAIVAIGPGDIENLAPRLGAQLCTHQHLRRAGQSGYHTLVSRDRAPVTGPFDQQGPLVLANLGPVGAFLAPAIARWLAGNGRPDEIAYFTAHTPARPLSPSTVAEYGPATPRIGAAA